MIEYSSKSTPQRPSVSECSPVTFHKHDQATEHIRQLQSIQFLGLHYQSVCDRIAESIVFAGHKVEQSIQCSAYVTCQPKSKSIKQSESLLSRPSQLLFFLLFPNFQTPLKVSLSTFVAVSMPVFLSNFSSFRKCFDTRACGRQQ